MVGNIFYSQVKPRVQKEVLARAAAGKINRDTKSMNFMLGVISNAEIIVYKDSTYSFAISKLGGELSKSKLYRPQEFLSHDSKRTVPFLNSVDLVIGDNSMNVLNRATCRITIPDPLRDLDDTETKFFRPGRAIKIRIESPKESLLTEYQQADLETDNDTETDVDYPRFVEFKGLITSFDYSYQTNGTIEATLSVTGTSNTYTDVTMLISSGPETLQEKEVDALLDPIDDTDDNQTFSKTNSTFSSTALANYKPPTFNVNFGDSLASVIPGTPPVNTLNAVNTNNSIPNLIVQAAENISLVPINTFYQRLSEDVNRYIDAQPEKRNQISFNDETFYHIADNVPYNTSTVIRWGSIYQQFDKKKSKTQASDYYRHISLAHLINYINFYVMKKMKNVTDTPWIHCTDRSISRSPDVISTPSFCNYYSELVSSNPERILLLGKNGSGSTNTYGDRVIGAVSKNNQNVRPFFENNIGHASRILISMDVIKEISDKLYESKKFRIKDFLGAISGEISDATGGAVSMKLITHPDNQEQLLFYDENFVNFNTTVQEFNIPLWANDPRGSIVQDFKITTKIPDNVKNLAYVLNQGVDEISDSDIAPYLNVMYADEEASKKLKIKYKQIHEDGINKLNIAKQKLGDDPTSKTAQQELRSALKKYLQYPTLSAVESNTINAPMFPYEVEFTMPGINGFRYGDVLQFSGLPERYSKFNVFLIFQITQTINTTGQWTTKFRCGMRPRLS